jgi:hypothetical protein
MSETYRRHVEWEPDLSPLYQDWALPDPTKITPIPYPIGGIRDASKHRISL